MSKSKPTYFYNSWLAEKRYLVASLKVIVEVILNATCVHELCHYPICKERRSLSI